MKTDKKDKVLEALERSLGIVSAACKEVNLSRETYYKWLKEDPDFKKRVEEIEDLQGDFVEHQLFKKIKEGSEKAIMFYMKYKGKKRGYAVRNEITGADGQELFKNIQFKFNKPTNE
jgi:hypothetical protein